MKKLLLLAFVLFFIGCKKDRADPKPFDDYGASVIREFKVKGVPDDSISFQDKRIIIKLPENYSYGDMIWPIVTMNRPNDKLETDITNGLMFEGRSISLSGKSEIYNNFDYTVSVIPAGPIEVSELGSSFEVVIGRQTYVRVPIHNVGTIPYFNESGQPIYAPLATLTEKGTGKPRDGFNTQIVSSDPGGSNVLSIYIPTNTSAGAYDLTLQYGPRKTEIKDFATVKYGELSLDSFYRTVAAENPKFEIMGVNIHPNHTYELMIFNDFIPAQKIKLTRTDYNRLSGTLPASVVPGNYDARYIVDSKEIPKETFPAQFTTNLHYLAASSQPALNFISQPRLLTTGECYIYKSTNTIERREDIVAKVMFAGMRENENIKVNLKLVHRDSGKAYFLMADSPRFTAECHSVNTFSQFPVPKEIPNGQYEVYAILGNDIKDAALTSEKLGQIVTIQ